MSNNLHHKLLIPYLGNNPHEEFIRRRLSWTHVPWNTKKSDPMEEIHALEVDTPSPNVEIAVTEADVISLAMGKFAINVT